MKNASLMDFNSGSMPDPEQFFENNKKLSPEQYRVKINESYGPAGRDKTAETVVNRAVLLYTSKMNQK